MGPPRGRLALLAGAMIAVFIAIGIGMIRLIPGPLRPTDYLVIGTLATFGALGTLFGAIIFSNRKPG